ncbi:MAG: L,D-transpeptidase family protein, partial [Pseudomonadota bacterium]
MSELKPNRLSRRAALSAMAAFGFAAGFAPGIARQVYKEAHELKPGEFSWHPERAKSGPVSIIVSLPDQLVHVYRNGIRIAVSTCSTGKKGHRTPTGVFTILQKDKHHHSSTYNNASMPNMNRLTWSGIALHAGRLPGYPASHGCIRLPLQFSALLFTVTHLGTPVIIASGHTQPREVVHPGMVLAQYAENEFEDALARLKGKHIPKDTGRSTSVIVSRADQQILIMENGEIVA